MNDIEVSSIDLVEGGNVFKQGHYLTLGYVPRDEKGETVDLSGKTLNVALWGRKGVVFEAAATYSAGVIRFTLDKMVPAGDYTVEFTVTSSTDAKYRKKFPTNQHSGRIAIKQSADDLGVVGIQVYTVAQLKAEQKALLDAAVSGFTVDSETKMARVSGNTTYTSLPARLEADKQATAAQLAETLKQGEVSVSDIDKNKGKFDQTYMSDSLLQQIAGTAPINAVPADESIGLVKTTIGKPKKNIFNPAKVTTGMSLSSTTGVVSTGSSWLTVSESMEVLPNEYYYFSKNITTAAIYDSNNVFLEGFGGSTTAGSAKKMPATAKYVKVQVSTAFLQEIQIELGIKSTPYEPYELVVDKKFTEKHAIKNSDLPLIDIKDTRLGVVAGKNLFNNYKLTDGANINHLTGDIQFNGLYSFSDFEKVHSLEEQAFSSIHSVAWYDSEKNFISGRTAPFRVIPPTNAVYRRVGLLTADINKAQIEIGIARTAYEPYREVIDKKYLEGLPSPVNPSAPSSNYSGFTETEMAQAAENAMKHIPNVKLPLNIPTYDGSNEPTHPSVLYFEDGWNGYKFWMAMTPYPNSNNKLENPSIVATNDNITWHEPAPNPIAPLQPENTYQADPCIFMKGNTMEMWYLVATLQDNFTYITRMYRKTTTDGVNWTDREMMLESPQDEIMRAATIRYTNGKYRAWYNRDYDDGIFYMKYGESVDGKVWEHRTLEIEPPGDGFSFWHGDVLQHDDGRVEMLVMCRHDTKRWATFYTASTDNIKWTKPTLVIKSTYPSVGRWDSKHQYRPAIVMVGDEYYVYYSTPSKIGLTKGRTLLSLGLGQEKLPEYPALFDVKNKFADMNAFTATDPIEAFPVECVTQFMVWSSSDVGWAELSGVVKVSNIFGGTNKGMQYFYPLSNSTYYYLRNSTPTGWSTWKKYTGVTV